MNGRRSRPTQSASDPPEAGKRDEASASQLSFEERFSATRPSAPPAETAPPKEKEPPKAKEPPRVLAVAELVRAARQALEASFGDVRVEGEVSGSKRSANGHFYFTLKDNEAQVDCVMYAREAARLKFKLGDGQLVRCRGKLTIYEGRGRFQLQILSLEPAGAGALALAFEALKQKLLEEGLFENSRKRPIPFLPRRIGVVTSRHGAVIRDIIRVAHRRFPVPILLAPTPVQGEGAALSIAAAMAALCKISDVDVIILARGGGSMEDLWAFNDEALARAIACCPCPVISAVGHETDFTIADFVADVRAPTPSAAAELAVPVAAELLTEVRVLSGRLGRALLGQIGARRLTLERGRARMGNPHRLINERRQRVDELSERMSRSLHQACNRRLKELQAIEGRLLRAHPQRRIADQRAALGMLERRLSRCGSAVLGDRRRGLEALSNKLDALSPLKVLDRGYSLTRGPDGKVLRGRAGLAPGDALTVTLRDGDLRTRIEEIVEKSK